MIAEPLPPEGLAEVIEWRQARGLLPWPAGWIEGALGFWVPRFAAGWLVPTTTKRALLEDFIANPAADKKAVNQALFAVEAAIVAHARALGYTYLIGTTKLDVIRSRVREAGYSVSDPVFSTHIKRLTENT